MISGEIKDLVRGIHTQSGAQMMWIHLAHAGLIQSEGRQNYRITLADGEVQDGFSGAVVQGVSSVNTYTRPSSIMPGIGPDPIGDDHRFWDHTNHREEHFHSFL